MAAGDPASALPAGVVAVDDAWTRATVGAQRSTGAFMSLQSTQPMKLVGVESAAAQHVEIHEMALVDNIMRMRAVDVVPIVPGQRVDLQPSGLHVMLIDLVQPIQVGDVVAGGPADLVVLHADLTLAGVMVAGRWLDEPAAARD